MQALGLMRVSRLGATNRHSISLHTSRQTGHTHSPSAVSQAAHKLVAAGILRKRLPVRQDSSRRTTGAMAKASWRKVVKRAKWKTQVFIKEFVEFFWELVYFIVHTVKMGLYHKTLPVTSRLLCRAPAPPVATIKDIRANRIRLEMQSSYSSPFNVEKFEIEWAAKGSDSWSSIGVSDLQQRTVARLKQDSEYKFRVRAHGRKGVSGWCEELQGRTRIDPVNGGGRGPGFTWEQTHTDVSIMFEVPPKTAKRDLILDLKSESIKIEVCPPGGPTQLLLEGDLYGKVKTFTNGSFWELVKEGNKLMLNLTLEKFNPSVAPKFDYWRAVIPGHDEIDTHKIVNEENSGLQMLQPGQYDPVAMRNMGVKGF